MILFDTDVVSYIIRGIDPYFSKFLELDNGEWGISSVVAFELGCANKLQKHSANKMVADFLTHAKVYNFDANAAEATSQVAAVLKSKGKRLATEDLFIAGHSLSLNAILVSNNLKHFERVSGLHVVDWSS